MQITAINSSMNYSSRVQNNRNQNLHQNNYAANPSFNGWGTYIATGVSLAFLAGLGILGSNFEAEIKRPENIRIALNEQCPQLYSFVMPKTLIMKQNVRDLTSIEEAKVACSTLKKTYNEAIMPNNTQARTNLEKTADDLITTIKFGVQSIGRYKK